MEEIPDFETFYKLKVAPNIEDLKLQGSETSGWSIGGIFCMILAAISFILGETGIAIFFLGCIILAIYKYTKHKERFVVNYKETIISEIIKYLNPEMVYTPKKFMSSMDYDKSGLYRRSYDSFNGDDYMQGVYKNVRFYCSELETGFQVSARDPTNVRIFKGLFFAVPLKIPFMSATYIWPNEEEQFEDPLDAKSYQLIPLASPNLYKMNAGIPRFDNNFSIFSTNPNDASSLIDPDLMERLVSFKKQIERDIRLSFVNNILYVSINMDEEMFEPSTSHPGDKEKIKSYFFNVLLILSIINQLNLTKYP
jgi:hypothetical protein